jgi:hypothetical protein
MKGKALVFKQPRFPEYPFAKRVEGSNEWFEASVPEIMTSFTQPKTLQALYPTMNWNSVKLVDVEIIVDKK